jgi:hypothetical protein
MVVGIAASLASTFDASLCNPSEISTSAVASIPDQPD